MIVYGYDTIAHLLSQDGYLFKMLLNDIGVVLFPHTAEHRDVRLSGISYADDSQGNAMAAMVKPGRIEIRHHQKFSDQRVKRLVERMLELPEMSFAASFIITYQGRVIVNDDE